MNNKIVFYTTHCPKCKVLEMKLKQKKVEYISCDDVDLMLSKNISSAPKLEVNGELLDFAQAVAWVNGQ